MCPHTTLECVLLGILDYATRITLIKQMLLQVQTKCLWEVKTLILPSYLKILGDSIDQFFFSRPLPGHRWLVMGIIISH